MLQNAYLLAKIGADTAENEQHFAEILPIGRRVADRSHAAGLVRPPEQPARHPRGGGARPGGPRQVLGKLRAISAFSPLEA